MTEHEARRILQLEDECSPETIRESYLHLVKVWHPDRFEHDPRLRARAARTLIDINEAYAVLQQRPRRPSGATRQSSRSASDDVSSTVTTKRATLGVSLRRAVVIGTTFGVLVAVAWAAWPRPRRAAVEPAATNDTAIDASDSGASPPVPQRSAVRPPLPIDDRRPLSGTGLSPASQRGKGSVPIFNGGAYDAVVVLAREGTQVYATYVRAGEKVEMVGVISGDYDVLFTVGRAWREDRFTQGSAFLARNEPLQVRDPLAGEQRLDKTTLVLPQVRPGAEFRTVEPFSVQLP